MSVAGETGIDETMRMAATPARVDRRVLHCLSRLRIAVDGTMSIDAIGLQGDFLLEGFPKRVHDLALHLIEENQMFQEPQ